MYGLQKIKKKKHPFKSVGGGTLTQNYESYTIYNQDGELVRDQDIRWDALEIGFDCSNKLGLQKNLAFWENAGNLEKNISQSDLLEECLWEAETPVEEVTEYFEMDWEWGKFELEQYHNSSLFLLH